MNNYSRRGRSSAGRLKFSGSNNVKQNAILEDEKPEELFPKWNREMPKIPKDDELNYVIRSQIKFDKTIKAAMRMKSEKTGERKLFDPKMYGFQRFEFTELTLPRSLIEMEILPLNTSLSITKAVVDEALVNKSEIDMLIEKRIKESDGLGQKTTLKTSENSVVESNLKRLVGEDNDDTEIDVNFDFDNEEIDDGTDYTANYFDNDDNDLEDYDVDNH